ncbi:MAG: hypothetical protein JSU07_02845 [Bacteroidetes bacterium]|nr:hypothetical protein [Bacteroidota bacterium]
MEKECQHCKKTFTVKRIDSVYCSRSCRQMAYMVRKATKPKPLEITSVIPGKLNAGLSDNQQSSIIKAKIRTPEIEQKYEPHESRILNLIHDRINDDRKLLALNTCINTHEDIHSYWVGIRLRCLAECLLLFSEAKLTRISDLMELCNAFTQVRKSIHYQNLPDVFPYKSLIEDINHKLKSLCIKAQKAEQVKFHMKEQDKIGLIAVRYELAQFFRKEKFSQINFE